MKKITPCLILLLSMLNMPIHAEEEAQAISLSADELSGAILEGQPVIKVFGNDAQVLTVYTSKNNEFDAGIFGMIVEEPANGTYIYESFPVHEVMFFMKGSMKLIDDNGKVTEAGPGEVLVIPTGWSGTRIVEDIVKFSVRYRENP